MMRARSGKWKLALPLLLSLGVLCGCAHHYLLSLDNGDQVLSLTKPKLQDKRYQFTGEDGVEHVIARNRVEKIRAVSIAEGEKGPEAAPKPRRPRHWYLLWLD